MITINLIWLIVSISLVLLSLGFYFQKKALLLVILAGVILLITGLNVLIDPIVYSIGENHTFIYGDNYTNYHWDYDYSNPNPNADMALFHENIYNEYTTINNYINLVFGWLFIILGLASIYGGSVKLYDSRYDEEDQERFSVFK